MSTNQNPSTQDGYVPAEELNAIVGKRIRECRKARKLTQAQAAFPLTRSYMCLVEKGGCSPSVRCVHIIARNMDMTVSELLEGIDA